MFRPGPLEILILMLFEGLSNRGDRGLGLKDRRTWRLVRGSFASGTSSKVYFLELNNSQNSHKIVNKIRMHGQ